MSDAARIGVLTFHRCINYGSYWQARCLVDGLRSMGHDAVLLDHDAPEITGAEWRCAFQPLLPVRTPRADLPLYAAKTRRFLAALDALPQSPRFSLHQPENAGAFDAVVVGSDEVWNLSHPWYGHKRIFYGDGLNTKRLVSYAASFGNHDADRGLDSFWAEKLARFDAISVRDENSRRLVVAATGCDPEMVLDPCLQFPPPPAWESGEERPYLALYGHGFPDWFAAAVRRWADGAGRRILSIGYACEWADEARIDVGPEGFSALIAGADAVATNFFHGCVFALHHARPFVCATTPYRLNKVRDLTTRLAAERHLVGEEAPDATYAALLGEPLDPAIGERIAAMRAQSSAYLARALG